MSAASHPNSHSTPDTQSPDLVIVGGGIVGLWCAERAAKIGLKTVLVEKGRIGDGASGGFLGALMPHQPVNWTAKKAFQLDALLSLETEVGTLEDATGLTCGYRRCGRLMPIYTNNKLRQSPTWQSASKDNWPTHSPSGRVIKWALLPDTPNSDWLSPKPALLACDFDTLSARVNPRAMLQTLATKCTITNVEIRENTTVRTISKDGTLTFEDGSILTPGHVIVAAGYDAFNLLKPLTGIPLGFGVKGQAALLQPRTPVSPDLPIIYARGTYIISHDNGLVAIGSTSETIFDHPRTVDGELEDLIQNARALCPCLEGAVVVERWAGVRPKAVGREPVVGAILDAPKIVLASGGFKISFGIAHRLADAALGAITGRPVALPPKFDIAHHYASVA